MKNFGRAIRLAFKFRLTAIGTILSALVVAAFWGGNIGVLYPIVEVVFHDESMPEWIDKRIEQTQEKVVTFRAEAEDLQGQLDGATGDQRHEIAVQLDRAEMRIGAEEEALEDYRWWQPTIHSVMPNDSFQTLLVICGVLLLGTLVKDLFLIANTILSARLSLLTEYELRNEFFRRTLRLDMASFGEHGRGDLMNRFTSDMGRVTGGIQLLFGKTIREPLKMIVCLVLAAMICWQLLLLSLIVAPLAAYLIDRLAKSLKRANRRAMEEQSQIFENLGETFSGMKIVKAFTAEPHERNRFNQTAKTYFAKAMKIARYNSLVRPLTEVMGILIIVLAILVGSYLALNQETHLLGIRMSDRPFTLGTLLVFYAMLAGVSDPARKLSDLFNGLQAAAAASDRIYELMDREPRVSDPATPKQLPLHHDSLVLKNVDFGYHPGTPVLEEISLRIERGETVAMVGPNGCGKTTLASLIPRFFDPVAGSIHLDGIDLREVRIRDLRKQIGMVTQETLLFDDTVINNIRYGSPQATHDEVVEAAQRAHAHRFIEEKLTDGYETVVGPAGNRLSGGQRQRIALARAILRDPPILILDEATSQVDLESEKLIHLALEEFIRDRTTLIITHRLSTLVLADRVVVMNQGRIVDVGTHDELRSRCELYSRLYRLDLKESA